jgi:hypothetical protein
MLSVIILRVVLIYFYSECSGAKCSYTESRVFIVNSEYNDVESRQWKVSFSTESVPCVSAIDYYL